MHYHGAIGRDRRSFLSKEICVQGTDPEARIADEQCRAHDVKREKGMLARTSTSQSLASLPHRMQAGTLAGPASKETWGGEQRGGAQGGGGSGVRGRSFHCQILNALPSQVVRHRPRLLYAGL